MKIQQLTQSSIPVAGWFWRQIENIFTYFQENNTKNTAWKCSYHYNLKRSRWIWRYGVLFATECMSKHLKHSYLLFQINYLVEWYEALDDKLNDIQHCDSLQTKPNASVTILLIFVFFMATIFYLCCNGTYLSTCNVAIKKNNAHN